MHFAARLHPYGTYTAETDFYQYYAPDSERLAQGVFRKTPTEALAMPSRLQR